MEEIVKNNNEIVLIDDVCSLVAGYRGGKSVYKLQHCVRAAYTFTEEAIRYAARTQLTRTNLRTLKGIVADS